MEFFEYILIVASFGAVYITALYMARRLSKKVKESAEKTRRLKEELEMATETLKESKNLVADKDREIAHLKTQLENKEAKIAEMQEQLKFVERVSKRDIIILKRQVASSMERSAMVLDKVVELGHRVATLTEEWESLTEELAKLLRERKST